MLNVISTLGKNILTIENPVEYELRGITQVSVDPDQKMGFAEALRAGLRQDPDVILVGEIRDEETIEIAVKVALADHLVLTTLHSWNALTVIQGLVKLGISRDFVAETLNFIVSQKLVRRLCRHRGHGKTCSRCRGSGYSRRVPLYEILRVNQDLRDRIRKGRTGKRLTEGLSGLYICPMWKTAGRLAELKRTDWQE